MSSRANIPFFIAGAIASLTLITSGVFAVAPYVAFLSSVAALNIAPPVIFILFALSAVVIVFSYKMIKQSKKSQENSKAEVEELNKELRKEENTLAPIEEELENEEAKENKKKLSDLEKKVERISDSFVTKDKVEGLKKEVSDLSARLINSPATKNEVEAKLNMEFYAKGEARGWNTTFDNIILPNDIREKLKEICELQGRGYLLYGPPGTGKTSISKAIANQTKSLFAFMFVSASCLSNQSNIDQVFEKAEANSPCIIFIDEIDGIGKKRTFSENAGPLTHLLTKLDREFLSSKNITVVAATNHKNHLDFALIRGGRLECIEVPGLDKDDTRQKILQERLEKLKDSDMKILVQASKGFSMANLICLIDKINETTEKGGEIKYLRTFCKNFKKEHNIKDEPDKKHSNGETKNKDIRLSFGSLSRSSSVSSSLSDVSSRGSKR
ncbi:ATPase, AAA family [Wolbachia endosymbiont of Drosophila simulans wNo]|uniref:AAA family ATPase n=1 Tax=unclassified Wolbachia TaxID=2640676 RepID=UPI0002D25107|nr:MULTISPECIES: AAA family ATPase [unclassified Wolbachia]AGJ99459.1 ATPase, AAA family [Wolbachia endosymbiont of Drosophila simulans wNo]QCB62496.1 AAA family ATPase [Wolbachia endosymbiont of Drosophila mauritiana]QCB63543.1 AAA family ATPase [Wolbachia endosymbiont of Drosophila mauritiana]QWE33187.1 ATPase, AAA family [Wolbachia endosymbiont of Drosophila simulans]TGB06880.1 AAA family ATPase [Wolbachia endosymbiont of Drosophila mauritiana]